MQWQILPRGWQSYFQTPGGEKGLASRVSPLVLLLWLLLRVIAAVRLVLLSKMDACLQLRKCSWRPGFLPTLQWFLAGLPCSELGHCSSKSSTLGQSGWACGASSLSHPLSFSLKPGLVLRLYHILKKGQSFFTRSVISPLVNSLSFSSSISCLMSPWFIPDFPGLWFWGNRSCSLILSSLKILGFLRKLIHSLSRTFSEGVWPFPRWKVAAGFIFA